MKLVLICCSFFLFHFELTAQHEPINGSLDNPPLLTHRADSSNLMLQIHTDCYPQENTWFIYDQQENVVLQGGPYFGQAMTEINEGIWLESGNYTFTFYDAAGDGLYASQWGTCEENGSFELVDAAGNVLLQNDGTSNFDSLSVTFELNATVGVQELFPVQSIRTYPNPFHNQLWFDLNLRQPERITIEIFSIDGRLQHRVNATQLSEGRNTLQVGVEHLRTGSYIVRISAANESETHRIVKLK